MTPAARHRRAIAFMVVAALGTMLAVRSNRDEFSLIIPYVRFARETTQHEPLVIDTNIIIYACQPDGQWLSSWTNDPSAAIASST